MVVQLRMSVLIIYLGLTCLFIRRKQDGSHEGTTWQIKFNLSYVDRSKSYKLRIALASATLAELQVWMGISAFTISRQFTEKQM